MAGQRAGAEGANIQNIIPQYQNGSLKMPHAAPRTWACSSLMPRDSSAMNNASDLEKQRDCKLSQESTVKGPKKAGMTVREI